jgi:membrane-anchored protein YejM (alkaline phosphatase superfamily)
MNIDWPHMIVTMVLIFAVILGLGRLAIYKEASKGKRFLLMAVSIFIVVFVFNLIWPYN